MDSLTRRIWAYRALYVALCLGVAIYSLLPLSPGEVGIPAPDLVLAITLAWVVRQPDTVPPLAVVGVGLFCDFLFLRPPGLMTFLTLMATEYLRKRRSMAAELPFFLEWALAVAAIFAVVLGYRLALWILLVDQAGLGLSLLYGAVTALAYPVVVGVSKYALGVTTMHPQEPDTP